MGEQAVTGAGGTPAPERMPDAGGDDVAAATGSGGNDAARAIGGGEPTAPGATTAGMSADGRAAASAALPGAGMSADASAGEAAERSAAAAAAPRELTADLVAGPGGVMTDEVGVITGELTLRTTHAGGRVHLSVQYKDADEWYTVTGGTAELADPAGLDPVHRIALALLNRPEG
ncbi:hypothetical protein [Micromonospora sp. KC723]|uniref:hypothetical protein n=1 Tax=Micromonospora sp. KC723 TaxID=2530381 RepID=UPI00104631C0|nr:hypothetical protein [Micromonospora sp. KC723]TDB74206.1 hypothetical protein E1165_15230 [Micromonospora sp. KC723]